MDVGFVGLGSMGRAMAQNMAKAGHAIRAWNRSALAADTVESLEIVANPRDAFQADVVFTMLSDDAAIRDVLLSSGVLRHARHGVIHVVTSTISLDMVEELRVRHAEAGVTYVAAPVFGRPDVAAAGELNVLAAGDDRAIAAIQPLLDVIGRKTWVLGNDPKHANAAKIAGNMMIAMAIEAMAEAVVLTTSNGVEASRFVDLITQTLFGGRAYENYGAKIVNADFEAGFKMRLGLKDLGLAERAAERAGKHLPLLDAVHDQMSAAVGAGMGEQDWSAIADYTINGAR